MILRTPLGERPYVLRSERELDPKLQTRVKVRDLTELERIECYDLVEPRGADDRTRGQLWFSRAILQRAFLGFYESHPPRDEDGLPVEFTVARDERTGLVSDECLAQIDPNERAEIAMAVWARTSLSEEELGKSEPSPGGPPSDATQDGQTTSSPGVPKRAEA